jgi:hypothetical protein
VHRVEKELLKFRIRENLYRVRLYRIRAKRASQRLHLANGRVGKARNLVRKSGQSEALKFIYSADTDSREGELISFFFHAGSNSV